MALKPCLIEGRTVRIRSKTAWKRWEDHYGEPLPKMGRYLHMMHLCNDPRCGEPSHLTPGSPGANLADAYADGLLTKRGEAHHFARFTEQDVLEIRRLAAAGVPRKEIVARFGCSKAAVQKVIARTRWGHI